jgi:flagellin
MGSFSILNNIPGLNAQNNLTINSMNLSRTLFRLSSGSRINNGGDDPAGLNYADSLRANITSLQQSVRNANDGVGALQVADGAYAQITNMLNRAVTLATEAANSTLNATQRGALDSEFTQIKNEIDRIGSRTQYNGSAIFNSTLSVYTSDGTSNGTSTIAVTISSLSQAALNLNSVAISGSDPSNANNALTSITTAVSTIALNRGQLGAYMNRLQAAANVLTNVQQNTITAEDGIRATNVAEEIQNMTRFNVLNQTGIASLSQANAKMQSVLALLR